LKKIGIYGGTFDPVHHGHLILAREALEQLDLEKVIFVPAAISPFKEASSAPAAIRLQMLRAAVEGVSGFVIDDCELHRPPPSYTIDTVGEIRQRERNAAFCYLLGDDNVEGLGRWHRFAELKELVQFVVLDRTGTAVEHPYSTVRRKIDISATDIRKRVASGRTIRYLVPREVEQIIREANLYREQGK
jgi:nicotinate-nucleotide adenylyltransferase